MGNPTDTELAQLAADWPRWEIWQVHHVIGGTTWCARRHDDHAKVLNAGSASHLAEYLADEVTRND